MKAPLRPTRISVKRGIHDMASHSFQPQLWYTGPCAGLGAVRWPHRVRALQRASHVRRNRYNNIIEVAGDHHLAPCDPQPGRRVSPWGGAHPGAIAHTGLIGGAPGSTELPKPAIILGLMRAFGSPLTD